MALSGELGQGSELRLLRVGRQALQGLKVLLISVEAVGDDGVGLLTRLVRAAELVDGEKGCSVESALVDQMELLKGVVADHGLQAFPRNDCAQKKKKKKKKGVTDRASKETLVGECWSLLRSERPVGWNCWARSAEGRCWGCPRGWRRPG